MENRDLQSELATEKEKSAHWICKHTTAEQKYLTQSNVIAKLRGQAEKAEAEAEKWRIEAFRKYPTPEAYEAACAALEKHRERGNKAEEREQKLKELIGYEMELHVLRGSYIREKELKDILSTLYPLDREENVNV